MMRNRTYSQTVFEGMRNSGINDDQIARILHVRSSTLKKLCDGVRELSGKHDDLIELATGTSAAQFAARILDPSGKHPLTKSINRLTALTPMNAAMDRPRPETKRKKPILHRSLKLA